MNRLCYNKLCYYYDPSFISPKEQVETISCPTCDVVRHCSQKCRDQDWLKSHSQQCQSDLDEYTIIEELGHGTYGKVMLVEKDGTKFAMKIIPKGIFSEVSNKQMQREINIHKKMDHENIIKLYAFSQDRDSVKLILELAEGGPLICNDDSSIMDYFEQICRGIQHLHSNGIIHRDLKPENILLSKGIVKLCDFGWSAEVDLNQQRDTMCGTYEYMAPEISQGKYSFKVDMWSLGVILYEMYHKSLPQVPLQFKCPPLAQDLISKLLTNPADRLTIDQVFEHPFMCRESVQTIDFTQFNVEGIDLFNQLDMQLNQENIPRCTDILRPRISRISCPLRNNPPVPEKKSILDQIWSTLGCVNRPKQ